MGQENRDKVLSLVTETRPSQPNKSVRRIVSIQGIVIYVQPTHTIRRVVQTLTRSEPIWRRCRCGCERSQGPWEPMDQWTMGTMKPGVSSVWEPT